MSIHITDIHYKCLWLDFIKQMHRSLGDCVISVIFVSTRLQVYIVVTWVCIIAQKCGLFESFGFENVRNLKKAPSTALDRGTREYIFPFLFSRKRRKWDPAFAVAATQHFLLRLCKKYVTLLFFSPILAFTLSSATPAMLVQSYACKQVASAHTPPFFPAPLQPPTHPCHTEVVIFSVGDAAYSASIRLHREINGAREKEIEREHTCILATWQGERVMERERESGPADGEERTVWKRGIVGQLRCICQFKDTNFNASKPNECFSALPQKRALLSPLARLPCQQLENQEEGFALKLAYSSTCLVNPSNIKAISVNGGECYF